MRLSVCLILAIFNMSLCITLRSRGIQYSKCDCSIFKDQSDCDQNCYGNWCLNSSCTWDGFKCQNPNCSQLPLNQCDKFSNCYINSQSSCVEFQSCSQVDSTLNSCVGQNCYPPDPTSPSKNCQQAPYKTQKICSQLTTQSQCNESQQDLLSCLWINGSCFKVTCSVLTSKSDCDFLSKYCIFSQGSCRQLSCEDFLIESKCSTIYDIATVDTIQCMFIQNKCINPTLSQLNTQDLCSVGTLDTYAFISGSCLQCKKSVPETNTGTNQGTNQGTNPGINTGTNQTGTNTTLINSTETNSGTKPPEKNSFTRTFGFCKSQKMLFVLANLILFILQ